MSTPGAKIPAANAVTPVQVPIQGPIISGASTQTVDLTTTDITFESLRGFEPLLLLPVRIETRFADTPGGPQLWVRIFPDQFAIDSHDPNLTADEWAAALQYWTAMWPLMASQTNLQQQAWASLAATFGPRRAAYIANRTGPSDFDSWASSGGSAVLGTGRTFPTTAPGSSRPSSWSQPAMARALPAQWFVMLTAGTTTQVVEVTRLAADLAVSLDPGATGAIGAPGGPTSAMSWLSDFTQAQNVGMAVAININAAQRATGFDQVVVFGVTGDYGPAGQAVIENLLTAHRYTAGFDFIPQGAPTKNSPDSVSGYTRSDPGFTRSFMAERTGVSSANAGAATPLQLQTGSVTDAQLFAGALGVDPSFVIHAQNAAQIDQRDAVAMSTAAWPATGDYFLRYILGVSLAPSDQTILRQFVTQSVRARGSVPPFRIGTTPYGVLPVIAPANALKSAAPAGGIVANYVQKARGIWESTVQKFPVQAIPGTGTTPEQALANVLGRDASTVVVNGRFDTGPWFTWNLAQWDIAGSIVNGTEGQLAQSVQLFADGMALVSAVENAQRMAASQAAALGWTPPSGASPAAGMIYAAPLGCNLRHVTVDGQVSDTANLPETHTLVSWPLGRRGGPRYERVNVLGFMQNLTVTALLSFVPNGEDLTLLAVIVRQALLLEYANAAGQILGQTLSDPEECMAPPGQQPNTLLWALSQTVYTPPAGLPAASGTLGDYIWAQVQTTAGQAAAPFQALVSLLDAIEHLSGMTTAALERVLLESLDLCSYRLDAWATAVATATLFVNRSGYPNGISLGAWAYLENLRPTTAQALTSDELAALPSAWGTGTSIATPPVAPTKDTTGFIFAPSLTHAATGAILRNGYLSHAGGSYGAAFAIDLSSSRVRAALALMEGIRQGQPLGALLGYLFEQGLNEAGLQVLLQPFRSTYPIVANKMTQYAAGPADAVAASNVVDGAALQQAWESDSIPWGQGGLPATADPTYSSVTGLLDMLSDRVDALNDIAVAESIYEVAKGNPVRTGGALNASSREQHPPQPQVIDTPRTGLDLTQRVLSLFAVNPASPPTTSIWLGSAPSSPRASAEPWLEAWLNALLPNPANVQFQVNYTPEGGGAAVTSDPLTLATAGLAALDLLALAPPPPSGASASTLDGSDLVGSDLDRWLLVQYAGNHTLPSGATPISLVYSPSTPLMAPLMSIPQLLVLVRSLQETIRASRPLVPADLVPPATTVPVSDLDLSGIATRLSAACTALVNLNSSISAAISALSATLTAANGDALSLQLMNAAAFGFPGSPPVTTARDAASLSALLAQADTINTAVARRIASLTGNTALYNPTSNTLVLAAPPPSPPPTVPPTVPPTPTPSSVLKLAQDTAEAIFGPRFMVLPVITPTTTGSTSDPVASAAANLAAAVAAWNTSSDHLSAAGVLQQLTHIRPPIARLDEMLTLSSVLSGAPAADFAVAQLGGQVAYSPSNPWLGVGPLSSPVPPLLGSSTTLQGSYALLVWTPAVLGSTTGASMCGLWFDEWLEQIPNSAEKPAVAFHYAEPSARAPQSLLLAIAPASLERWSARTVRDTVLEAVALAKIRTVDPQTLELGGQVGQLLPALFAGFGPFTVSSEIPALPTSINPVGS